jgi:phosphoglycerate kinase
MEREISNIGRIKMKNALFILGGAKCEDNLLLLKKRRILSTGIFSLLCLIASGHDLGMENRRLKGEKKVIDKIKKNLKHIKMPVDLAIKKKGRRKDMVLEGFPQNSRVLDIGIKTIEMYEKEIMKAKRIFWKGTAGYAENKNFALGTKRLLKAIEKSKAFCVVAGGHSSTAIEQFGIKEKKIGYVSLSGGALIHYLAGKKLQGLEVLKK